MPLPLPARSGLAAASAILTFALIGCDPNPGGPSAPTLPEATTPGKAGPAPGAAKTGDASAPARAPSGSKAAEGFKPTGRPD